MTEWISVEERLPGYGEGLFSPGELFYEKCTGNVYVGYYDHKEEQFTIYGTNWDEEDTTVEGSITHWMPLPEPPK